MSFLDLTFQLEICEDAWCHGSASAGITASQPDTLCRAVECSTAQCSVEVHNTVQHSIVQCTGARPNAVQWSTVQYSEVQRSTTQGSAVQCSAVQCSAVKCNAVQLTSGWWLRRPASRAPVTQSQEPGQQEQFCRCSERITARNIAIRN